ncbi:MAG: penicillin acylase family protein [Candidatus Thermofonsia Clade 1 bacterium]|uniref:Penicillin acylase family protein n=1 Tax=Candidatus Thermofonsia Clade 1 bacterium TaxID=2364210 RepID=A0A2M8PF17_9CHLR|nr:MAG: penicillin acylase family protein [Candidatus Thermofonsia Clade 1 bacterium]
MRRFRRILLVLVLIAVLVLGAAGGLVAYTLQRPLPQLSGTLKLNGLSAPVTIYRDAQGTAHIYARTSRDLFFAQGVVHAQERWWQMEFQRHVGQGRIGELTGRVESVLRSDMFIRTVGWKQAAENDLRAISTESRSVLEAYASGVNAYIGGRSPSDLALEYTLLGLTGVNIAIAPWEPLHSVVWGKVLAWQLSGNFNFELNYLNVAQRLGEAKAAEFLRAWLPEFPYASRQSIIQESDLPILPAVPRSSTQQIAPQRLGILQRVIANGLDAAQIERAFSGAASNSWVVNGTRTASGKPLMANDPHLGPQMPSLFYSIGLHCAPVSAECPYDVVGFSLPGTPGVLIGHNGRIAWALTTPYTDTQDLYAIQLDPSNPDQYIVDGETLRMGVSNEEIRFGDDPSSFFMRVRQTIFGPIITDLPAYAEYGAEKPLALRWAGNDPENPYDLIGALLAVNRAQNWEDFRAALVGWQVPSQNFLYADVDGNIGYILPGRVPIRAADHNGLTPVDGSTRRYLWQGYLPYEHMPRLFNPERGYIVAANQRIAPNAYAAQLQERFGTDLNYFANFNADYGYRSQRIHDLLLARTDHSIQTFVEIQKDTYNSFAEALMPIALNLDHGTAIPSAALDWLRTWDFYMRPESGQAAWFAAFEFEVADRLWKDEIGGTPITDGRFMWSTTLLLEQPDAIWWDNIETPEVRESRDDILRAALAAAYQTVAARLGQDFTKWRWDALHKIDFVSNPLGQSGISLIEDYVNISAVPVGGGAATINRASSYGDDPFSVTEISTIRVIFDFADLERSIGIHSTGQSGHPASPHYRDLVMPWRRFEAYPLRLDRGAIEAAAVHRLTLRSD